MVVETKPGSDRIDCRRCRHLKITWDRNFPMGCGAMGFKSRFWPSVEVLRTSGDPCLKFHPKPPVDPKPPVGRQPLRRNNAKSPTVSKEGISVRV